MVKYFIKKFNRIEVLEDLTFLESGENTKESIIWIDMLQPTSAERTYVEEMFDIKFPTKQESEEIEISSRYWEENEKIEINSYFLVSNAEHPYNEPVSFILRRENIWRTITSICFRETASPCNS